MKKHHLFYLMAASLLISLTACEYKYKYEPSYSTLPVNESGFQPQGEGYTFVRPVESKKNLELSRENLDNFNKWSYDLIRMTAQTHRGSSFLISPASVASGMSILSTALSSEGANLLANSTGMTLSDFQNTTREMMSYFYYSNVIRRPYTKRAFANAVWGNKGVEFSEAFRSGIASMYGTPATTLNFGSSSSRKIFNSCLYDCSEGMITDSRYPLDNNNKFQLTNAFYFNARWEYCFNPEDTHDAPFYGMTATRNVPTMHCTLFGRVLEDERFTIVRLGLYTPKAEAMYIILPNEGVDVFDLANELTYDYIQDMMLLFSPYNIDFSIPRLTMDKETNVAEAIYKMSSITANTTFNIDKNVTDKSISFNGLDQQLLHHAIYSFFEDGTYGTNDDRYKSNPRLDSQQPLITIAIDRPFMFIAMNTAYNIPMLAGIVADVD